MNKLSENQSQQFNSSNPSNSKNPEEEKARNLKKQHEEALNKAHQEIEQMESEALAKMFDGNKK